MFSYVANLSGSPRERLIWLRTITVDETGDFIGWKCHSRSSLMRRAVYGTLFDMRRSIPLPDIDLTSTKAPVPAQPQPVSMGPTSFLGSWLTFGNQSITGEQADELCEHQRTR